MFIRKSIFILLTEEITQETENLAIVVIRYFLLFTIIKCNPTSKSACSRVFFCRDLIPANHLTPTISEFCLT